MEPYKRDLPEIVAEILIEQHAIREEMSGMREESRESAARMENLFSVMTNAVLDAMNRQGDLQRGTNREVDDLRRRVESLENKVGR